MKCPRFSHLLRRNKTWGTSVFPKGTKNVGNIDYVAGWFIKAAEYMGDHTVRTAFVSTNSVVQGEQVANIWYPITQLGFHIDFAHDTFRWANEASDQAHVFCVIVSLSKQKVTPRLFHYETPDSNPMDLHPSRLNPYLADAPDIFVWNRNRPLCDVPVIGIGNKPIDDGNYLFTEDEKVASSILAGGSINPQLEQCSSWGIFLSSLAKSPQIIRAITERRQGTG